MKVRIGYTNRYVEVEDLSQLNNLDTILEDLQEENISCSFCKQKIKKDNWNMVVHNPKEENIPIRIHFFCFDKKCAKKWAELGTKDRSKILTGNF